MSVSPRGLFSLPPAWLAVALSECTSFQKLVQAASATAALAKAHVLERLKTEGLTIPHAIVTFPEFNEDTVAGGANTVYVGTGNFAYWFALPVRWSGTVSAATSATVFRASSLAGLADDHLNGLNFVYKPGTAQEETKAISDFTGATGEITLASGLAGTPSIGDAWKIRPASSQDGHIFGLNVVGDLVADLKLKSGRDVSDASGYLGGSVGGLRMANFKLKNFGLSNTAKNAIDTEYFGALLSFEGGH